MLLMSLRLVLPSRQRELITTTLGTSRDPHIPGQILLEWVDHARDSITQSVWTMTWEKNKEREETEKCGWRDAKWMRRRRKTEDEEKRGVNTKSGEMLYFCRGKTRRGDSQHISNELSWHGVYPYWYLKCTVRKAHTIYSCIKVT